MNCEHVPLIRYGPLTESPEARRKVLFDLQRAQFIARENEGVKRLAVLMGIFGALFFFFCVALASGSPTPAQKAQGEQRVSDVRIIAGTRWVAKIVTKPDGFRFCKMSVQEANGEIVSFTVGDRGTLALIIEDEYLENQISSVLPSLKQPHDRYSLRPSEEGHSYRAMLFLDDKNFNVSAIRIDERALLIQLKSIDSKTIIQTTHIALAVGSVAMRGYKVEGLGIAIPELQDCARQLRKAKQ